MRKRAFCRQKGWQSLGVYQKHPMPLFGYKFTPSFGPEADYFHSIAQRECFAEPSPVLKRWPETDWQPKNNEGTSASDTPKKFAHGK